jgi:hypothetical protein
LTPPTNRRAVVIVPGPAEDDLGDRPTADIPLPSFPARIWSFDAS